MGWGRTHIYDIRGSVANMGEFLHGILRLGSHFHQKIPSNGPVFQNLSPKMLKILCVFVAKSLEMVAYFQKIP